jgi:hypothetical protein
MNAFLTAIVPERAGEQKVLAQLQARATRADAAKASAVLDQALDHIPMAGDEVLR